MPGYDTGAGSLTRRRVGVPQAAYVGESITTYPEAVMAEGPAAYWRLDEPLASPFALDASGNDRHGTYNGPTLGVPGSLLGPRDLESTAADFHPTTWINVPLGSWTDGATQPFTIMARVRADALTSYRCIASKDGTFTRGWNLYARDGRLTGYNIGGTGGEFSGTTVMATGAWYSVAMTSDGATTRVFLNGVQDGSMAAVPSNPQADLDIGASWAGVGARTLGWDGRIDEVAFFRRALSAAELLDLHEIAVTE